MRAPTAGDLRNKVDLLELRDNRRRPSGYVASEWRAWLLQTPAAIDFPSAAESAGDRGRVGSNVATITVRNSLPRAINNHDAVLWRGRLFGVESALVSADDRWVTITAREATS